MPPRIATTQDVGGGFKAWWESLPPVTRNVTTAMLLTTVAFNHFLPLQWLVLYWPWVFKNFEIWRIVTTFFFLGRLNFKFLMLLMYMVQYGVPLERTTYQFDPAGHIFMLLFNGILLLCLSPFIGPILGVPLILSIVYIWSRNFQDQNISLYGMITLKAFYTPFAFTALAVLLGDSVIPYVAGIAVGHVYHFLHDLYPRQSGKNPLATPTWLRNWCADYGLTGAAPVVPDSRQPAPAAPQGFQAFRGRGQRLGASHED